MCIRDRILYPILQPVFSRAVCRKIRIWRIWRIQCNILFYKLPKTAVQYYACGEIILGSIAKSTILQYRQCIAGGGFATKSRRSYCPRKADGFAATFSGTANNTVVCNRGEYILRTNPKWICVKVKKPACLCRTSNIHQLHSRIPIKKRKLLLAATATGIVIYSSFILHCL